MSWGLWVLVGVLAVGFGYLGGLIAIRQDRRGRETPAARAGEAAFAMEHIDGQTWSVTNTGNAVARFVIVVPLADGVEHWPPKPPPDSLATATSERLPTLEPGASMSMWLSRHQPGQQVLIGWTSESTIRMGPVTLDVPAPDERPMAAGF